MKLIDAPVGLLEFNGIIFLKTEYSTEHHKNGKIIVTPDCYIVESGEYFWGGSGDVVERNNLEVSKVNIKEIKMTIEEKCEYVDKYCRKTDCEDCVLNTQDRWMWVHCIEGANEYCPSIFSSPESDLDKAISMIKESENN